jgi:hypothetical protein
VTAEIAKAHAESEFEKYRIVQDRLFESDFDRVVAETKRQGTRKEGREDEPMTQVAPRRSVQFERAAGDGTLMG